jgi:MFS transporter, ACS family, D-galactonate transporter
MTDLLATSLQDTKRARISPKLSRVAVLLGFSIFINYIDRGTLSIAAPLVKNELSLSATQLGILLSAFFYTYAPFQIVSGWWTASTQIG